MNKSEKALHHQILEECDRDIEKAYTMAIKVIMSQVTKPGYDRAGVVADG